MLQLANKPLPDEVQKILDDIQETVNQSPAFKDRVEKAKTLWQTKGGANGKRAFEEITRVLREMCVYEAVCNYCEHNEAGDIEHIYPKSFFPDLAFRWDNYLLACKQCNSGYKLDKCFFLGENGELSEVTRGERPSSTSIAMINPRTENPNDFLWLNTKVWKFEVNDDLSLKDKNKALKTIDILQLNQRDTLIRSRSSTAGYLYLRLKLLIDIRSATSVEAILQLIPAAYEDKIDTHFPIEVIKEQLTISFRKHITTYMHPSVWNAIKTIDSRLPDSKWRPLFDQIPEARNW